jgi:hypothetical protein
MAALGSTAAAEGSLADWLRTSPPVGKSVMAPPPEAHLLGDGASLLATPRCGSQEYLRAEFTTAVAGGSVRGSRLSVGDCNLRALGEGGGFSLYAESAEKAVVWIVRGNGLSAIGREIALCVAGLEIGGLPAVDVLSTWRQAMGWLFALLGPRRSAALAWKLHGADGPVRETQQFEAHAYAILAGWFPGLCTFAEAERCSLIVTRGGELYAILASMLADMGWLPDAGIHRMGYLGPGCAPPPPPDSIGTCIRLSSSGVTGHYRWLCIEPSEAGQIPDRRTLEQHAVALAERRGISGAMPAVICGWTPEDIRKRAPSLVLSSPSPLAVVVQADQADGIAEDVLVELRRFVFPYAAVILALGPGMRPRIDPRGDYHGGLPLGYSAWPAFTVRFVPELRPSMLSGGATAVVVSSQRYLAAELDKMKPTALYTDPAPAPGRVIAIPAENLEAIGQAASPAILGRLPECTRLFVRTPEWRRAACLVMHYLRAPFEVVVCER